MREVPAMMMDAACRAAERHGVDTRPILAEIGLGQVDPERKGERIDWDDYIDLIERCVAVMGCGPEALGSSYNEENRHMALARLLPVSPRVFYALVTLGSRPYMPHMRIDAASLPDGRFEARYDLPARYRDSSVLFRGQKAQYAHYAAGLGYPLAEVEADVGSHHGYYRVRLPEPDGGLTRLVDAGSRQVSRKARDLLRLFHAAIGAGVGWGVGEALQRRYGLTDAEARVAIAIAEGRSVAECARRLDIGDATVRSHLKHVFDKTDTHRQVELVGLVHDVGR